jgi:predicted nucleic acid-binding protein
LLSASDRRHQQVEAEFASVAQRGARLVTTSLVLAEVQRLVLFRAGRRAALVALTRIGESREVAVVFPVREDHESACAWLARRDDQDISYTDAMSFAIMQREGIRKVLTLDRDFWIAGFDVAP